MGAAGHTTRYLRFSFTAEHRKPTPFQRRKVCFRVPDAKCNPKGGDRRYYPVLSSLPDRRTRDRHIWRVRRTVSVHDGVAGLTSSGHLHHVSRLEPVNGVHRHHGTDNHAIYRDHDRIDITDIFFPC